MDYVSNSFSVVIGKETSTPVFTVCSPKLRGSVTIYNNKGHKMLNNCTLKYDRVNAMYLSVKRNDSARRRSQRQTPFCTYRIR